MKMGPRIPRIVWIGAAVFGLTAISLLPALAVADYSEEAIKAAYLYRFAGYISWPEPLPANTPFVIDVVGAPGLAKELTILLRDHLINGHAVEVREIRSARDWGQAQMIYVGAGHAADLRGLNSEPSGKLVVTDEEGGLSAGSELNFLTINRNVRFEVSLTAADRSGLKISSELLSVALRVLGSKRQSRLNCANPAEPEAGDLANANCKTGRLLSLRHDAAGLSTPR